MIKVLKSCKYTDPVFGPVNLRVRSDVRSIRARWKGLELLVTVPAGTRIEDFEHIMAGMADRIIELKPKCRYYDGQLIKFEAFTIEVKEDATDGCFSVSGCDDHFVFHAPPGRASTPNGEKAFDIFIKRLCRLLFRVHVLLVANEVYAELDCYPSVTTRSNGYKRLGYCTASGEIHLSSALVLLPEHLRRYVVMHELAHLTEMNHGAEFYKVLDRYTKGRTAKLEKELRAFKWPVAR